jgi:hypothetical protein
LVFLAIAFAVTCPGQRPKVGPEQDTTDIDKLLAEIEARAEKTERVKELRKHLAAIQAFLENADQVEAFRLNPKKAKQPEQKGGAFFHSYKVLRHVQVKKVDDRKAIAKALGAALHWNPLRQALCFNPRHGVRASHGGRSLDLVICLECSIIYLYEADKFQDNLTVTAKTCEPLDRVLRGR